MIENTSGLKPLGRAVLVKPYEPERKESNIVLPKSVHDRQVMLNQRAIVIEVGPAAWPDEPPRAQKGDIVIISAMAGWMANTDMTADEQVYLVINDRDIFCGVKDHE